MPTFIHMIASFLKDSVKWTDTILIPLSACTFALLSYSQFSFLPSPFPLSQQQDKAALMSAYFEEVEQLLLEDGGTLWGASLWGAVIIVNPKDRTFYANENNALSSFKQVGNIYTGTLPDHIPISNTAFEWEGKRWSMIMEPLPEKDIDRHHLMIHELFHQAQPALGFDSLQELSTAHLETKEARIFLKLEMEALKKALTDASHRDSHLQHAFSFRLLRYEQPAARNGENALEINEGICEYTALMLSGRNKQESIAHLGERIDQFYLEPSYLRSFAYIMVPVYGYMLSWSHPHWHKLTNSHTDLTHLFMEQFGITLDSINATYLSQRQNYDYARILDQETQRAQEIANNITHYRNLLVEGPVLALPFRQMNMSFDYTKALSLENEGTVYPTIQITDQWGILQVEKGALIDPQWSKAVVSVPMSIQADSVKGEGWSLALTHGWEVVQKGSNYELVPMIQEEK